MKGTCKHCGQRIVKWAGTDFWEHEKTGLYFCANDETFAEPR